MSSSWPDRILDALLALDEAEGPHGLYGIRQAHVLASGRLPTLAQVLLSDQRANFIESLDGKNWYGSEAKENRLSLQFEPAGRVKLRLLDHASTKVRSFGDVHRLDTYHGKPETGPDWNLEKLVPKLGGQPSWHRRGGVPPARALLLLAHAPSPKGLHLVTGRSVEADFLKRYDVALTRREWVDRYGRGFHSGLYLWVWQAARSADDPVEG